MKRAAFTLLILLTAGLFGLAGPMGGTLLPAAQAADSYDWTKPRGSIHRRRGPNLWSGRQPYRSPLYQRPSRNYGTPNWRRPRGINPYQKPRRNYGGWNHRD